MFREFKPTAFALFAIAVSSGTFGARPALALDKCANTADQANVIEDPCWKPYAGYYAPYAIMAAASYENVGSSTIRSS